MNDWIVDEALKVLGRSLKTFEKVNRRYAGSASEAGAALAQFNRAITVTDAQAAVQEAKRILNPQPITVQIERGSRRVLREGQLLFRDPVPFRLNVGDSFIVDGQDYLVTEEIVSGIDWGREESWEEERVSMTLKDLWAQRDEPRPGCLCRRNPTTEVLTLDPGCPQHGRRARGLSDEFGISAPVPSWQKEYGERVRRMQAETDPIVQKALQRELIDWAAARAEQDARRRRGEPPRVVSVKEMREREDLSRLRKEREAQIDRLVREERAKEKWKPEDFKLPGLPRKIGTIYGRWEDWPPPGVPAAVKAAREPEPEPVVVPYRRPQRKIDLDE